MNQEERVLPKWLNRKGNSKLETLWWLLKKLIKTFLILTYFVISKALLIVIILAFFTVASKTVYFEGVGAFSVIDWSRTSVLNLFLLYLIILVLMAFDILFVREVLKYFSNFINKKIGVKHD